MCDSTNIEIIQGDCFKPEEIDEALLRECTAVIHCVGANPDKAEIKNGLKTSKMLKTISKLIEDM